MFTEDKIAAARIAQIFGSELLTIQNKSLTDSGAQPRLVTIDPKQFLVSNNNQAQGKIKTQHETLKEQQIMRALQQEAESAYPLPSESTSSSSSQPVAVNQANSSVVQQQNTSGPVVGPVAQEIKPDLLYNPNKTFPNQSSPDVLERIAVSLEKIALNLEAATNKLNQRSTTKRKPQKAKQ